MKKLLFLLLPLPFAGCTDAEQAKLGDYGNKYTVEVVSGGQVVRTYTSTGRVRAESRAGAHYFKDAATGKLVKISGPVIITRID